MNMNHTSEAARNALVEAQAAFDELVSHEAELLNRLEKTMRRIPELERQLADEKAALARAFADGKEADAMKVAIAQAELDALRAVSGEGVANSIRAQVAHVRNRAVARWGAVERARGELARLEYVEAVERYRRAVSAEVWELATAARDAGNRAHIDNFNGLADPHSPHYGRV